MTDTTKKTNETSDLGLTDLSIQRLNEMENEVASLFPNEEDQAFEAVGHLHCDLLDVLSCRFIATGWEKKELIEMFTKMVDNSLDELEELKKAEQRKKTETIFKTYFEPLLISVETT